MHGFVHKQTLALTTICATCNRRQAKAFTSLYTALKFNPLSQSFATYLHWMHGDSDELICLRLNGIGAQTVTTVGTALSWDLSITVRGVKECHLLQLPKASNSSASHHAPKQIAGLTFLEVIARHSVAPAQTWHPWHWHPQRKPSMEDPLAVQNPSKPTLQHKQHSRQWQLGPNCKNRYLFSA